MNVVVSDFQEVQSKEFLFDLALVFFWARIEKLLGIFDGFVLQHGELDAFFSDLQVESERFYQFWPNLELGCDAAVTVLSQNKAELLHGVPLWLHPKTLDHEISFTPSSTVYVCILILSLLQQVGPAVDFLVYDRHLKLELVQPHPHDEHLKVETVADIGYLDFRTDLIEVGGCTPLD